MFLSKKLKLAQDKHNAAESIRRQKQAAKAFQRSLHLQLASERESALQRYCERRLKTIEEELQKEVELKMARMQTRSVEPKLTARGLKGRTRKSVDTFTGFKESRATLATIEPRESQTLLPQSTASALLGGKTTASVLATPATTRIAGRGGKGPDDSEGRRAGVKLEDEETRPKLSRARYSRYQRGGERMPPPAIPYSTRAGDVLSVHIVGGSDRKQSLDLHRLHTETPATLAREELQSQSFATVRRDLTPRLFPKPDPSLSEEKIRGRKLSPALGDWTVDGAESPKAQYHVFRDLSLDQ